MSTRSTTKFYSEFNPQEPVLCIYQQCDGYLEGVGSNLAEWLKDKKVINGIADQTMAEGYANGMGCLAAQYVAANKDCIGSFYATTASNTAEYNYEVRLIDGKIIIEVDDFKGTPDEFLQHIKTNA